MLPSKFYYKFERATPTTNQLQTFRHVNKKKTISTVKNCRKKHKKCSNIFVKFDYVRNALLQFVFLLKHDKIE